MRNSREDATGAAIHRLRLAAGMSTEEVARLAGVSEVHLSRVEAGTAQPTPAWIGVVSKVLARDSRAPFAKPGDQDAPSWANQVGEWRWDVNHWFRVSRKRFSDLVEVVAHQKVLAEGAVPLTIEVVINVEELGLWLDPVVEDPGSRREHPEIAAVRQLVADVEQAAALFEQVAWGEV